MTAPLAPTPPRRGRPPVEHEPRSADHRVRCTPSSRDLWRAAAAVEGVELAEKTRELLDGWAERALGEV